MRFTFNGRKMEITDSLKAYAEKKLSKLDRLFSGDAEATVVCRTERGRYTAEVTVRSANMLFRAQNTANDMYAAIDEVEDMIERQIRKNKTRLEKRLKSGAFEREIPAEAVNNLESEEDYEVVRIKRFAIKPMDVEEAILQMNLLGHAFYMFRDQESNEVCVVYRRKNGDYGLLEPDEE